MAENHGIDVDKDSHPRLLTLTKCLATYSKVLYTCSPGSPWGPSLTIQGQKTPKVDAGGVDDTQPSP
jgi:hypothetical protein